MSKAEFSLCKNKYADQLRTYIAADQRLCFLYLDSSFPRPSKAEISSP